MADYPNSIKNFLTLNDGVDRIVAAHPNDRAGEITAIETLIGALGSTQSYSASLKNLLIDMNKNVHVEYNAIDSVLLKAGEISIPDASGNVRFRRNTSDLTVDWGDIDIGAEANNTYYVYAMADSAGTGFTAKISLSSSLPYAGVFYRKIGTFANTAGNIVESSVENYDTVGHRSIKQTHLKTVMGAVSSTTYVGENDTLPGGEYGFYPQVKMSVTTSGQYYATLNGSRYNGMSFAGWTTYRSNITLGPHTGTMYAQQRYVTASGTDQWIFLKIDKNTKEILSAWQAPDHPSYGNGGDPEKLPHPFGSYDNTKHEIILLDKETCNQLKEEATKERDILTLVHEEYKPNMSKEEVYVPLHSGKFLGQDPVMIETIPEYITVRKLSKLTQNEKDDREVIKEATKVKHEEKIKIKNKITKSAYNKIKALGLTEVEIETIFE